MRNHVYLAPRAIAEALRDDGLGGVGVSWGGDPAPGELVLVVAVWEQHWERREKFEGHAGVIPLGEPWEPVPLAAIPMLESYRQSLVAVRAARIGESARAVAATRDSARPIDATHTVADALRKALPQIEDV